MFITKKHLSRRTFLRGAGVTLSLPLLESMVPALTPLRLSAATPKTRLALPTRSARTRSRGACITQGWPTIPATTWPSVR